MTIQTDANKLLADLYWLDENKVSGFELADTSYSTKLAACKALVTRRLSIRGRSRFHFTLTREA